MPRDVNSRGDRRAARSTPALLLARSGQARSRETVKLLLRNIVARSSLAAIADDHGLGLSG
jgi:hypothetical protein